jgi:hypothetical protein
MGKSAISGYCAGFAAGQALLLVGSTAPSRSGGAPDFAGLAARQTDPLTGQIAAYAADTKPPYQHQATMGSTRSLQPTHFDFSMKWGPI